MSQIRTLDFVAESVVESGDMNKKVFRDEKGEYVKMGRKKCYLGERTYIGEGNWITFTDFVD
jgi:hypothetical protein